ncbi:MAG: hypothetical protein R3216_11975 [Pseudomonas sp.]|nr:hypothetical protein [Pseudomonas sp.]MDX1368233.1 hypothetical protein [Pseudomonas sp.]
MYFWLTSASADFESGKSIKSDQPPAYFCVFSRREHLAAAISRITGAPLLHSSVNVCVPSTDSTARTVSPAARVLCNPPSVIHHALLRWHLTQDGGPATDVGKDGWLIQENSLWSRRAPARLVYRHFVIASPLANWRATTARAAVA